MSSTAAVAHDAEHPTLAQRLDVVDHLLGFALSELNEVASQLRPQPISLEEYRQGAPTGSGVDEAELRDVIVATAEIAESLEELRATAAELQRHAVGELREQPIGPDYWPRMRRLVSELVQA